MAFVSHAGPFAFDLGGNGLEPGQSQGVYFWGGLINRQATVAVTPLPRVSDAVSLAVGDLVIRNEPGPLGATPVAYAETTITNIGPIPVRSFIVQVATINY